MGNHSTFLFIKSVYTERIWIGFYKFLFKNKTVVRGTFITKELDVAFMKAC